MLINLVVQMGAIGSNLAMLLVYLNIILYTLSNVSNSGILNGTISGCIAPSRYYLKAYGHGFGLK